MTDHLVDPEAMIASSGGNALPGSAPAPMPRWLRWREKVRPLTGPVFREALAHAEAVHARDALDVRCGDGELARLLAAAEARRRVVAIDPSPTAIERAIALTARAGGAVAHNPPEFRVGWAEALPFDSASFDLVTSTLPFHRCGDSPLALAEFRRVLRPRGRLVLVDVAADHWLLRAGGACSALLRGRRGAGGRRPRTRAEMRDLLARAGLAPIEARLFRGFLALYVATY